MQNVQNAAEIQQRVINLVELYRTRVGKESQMAKDLAEEYKHQYDNEIDIAMYLHEQGTNHYTLNIDIPEEDVDWLRVNEQLLGHFYKTFAGSNADPQVLNELLADKYNSDIYSEEEEAFLITHFKELINYIIQTPNNDLSVIEGSDRMDFYLIPSEVLELIKKRVEIPAESKIYNPFTGFAQLTNLYPDCSFLCEESYVSYNKRWNTYCDKSRKEANVIHHKIDDYKLYAWMKVALCANNVDATINECDSKIEAYNAVITFLPWIPNAIPTNAYGYIGEAKNDQEIADKLYHAYSNLPDNGKMVVILPTEHLYGSTRLDSLWNTVVTDNSLVEILQLPHIMGKHLNRDCSIIIAEKGRKANVTTFTDVRFASIKTDNDIFKESLDLPAVDKMILNDGKEEKTGLRKKVDIPTSDLKVDLLVPQVYVVERPSENEKPVSLSTLCQLVTGRVREVKQNLPENTPLVSAKDLSLLFQGHLDLQKVEKANCPNNPPHTDEYSFDEKGNFVDDFDHYFWGEGTDKGLQVAMYRQSLFLDGNKDAVLIDLANDIPLSALCRSTGEPIAINTQPVIGGKSFHVICPNNGIDALYLLAILRLPIVYRQLQAYEEFGLYGKKGYIKDITVPTDMRIIYDEIQRLLHEQKTYKEQKDKLDAQRTEYINEVRMRKHDMGQYIFELVNIEDLMRYYVENRDKEENFCLELETLLNNFRSSLSELSTLLDNLSKEEEFGVSERFNLDEYLSQLGSRHKADGFKIEYVRNESSIKRYFQKMNVDNLTILDDGSICLEPNPIDDSSIYLEPNPIDDGSICLEPNPVDDSGICLEPNPVDDGSIYLEPNPVDDSSICLEPNPIDDNNVYTGVHGSTPHIAIPSIYVAPNDIHRAITNILDNARKHGFTEPNRNDYEVKVCLSIDIERNMFLVDFSNNGNPLPEGMDKMRYGIKGEKAGKTGGTGIGGSYVKKFVEHYGGDYDVFMDNGWTVIRIYLPIR